VAALQGRLGELGYWLGDAPGTFGATTAQAVMAFQKVEGLGRDGVAGPITVEHLAGATRPRPRGVDVAGRSVEIDLDRQVVLLVEGGETTTVLNTSTGRSGLRTPQGRFTVTREIDGIRKAPLGDLYRPKYFHKGIALHGSPSIPGQPASHGCARLHDDAMDLLWSDDLVPVGTPVWVYAA
jgi:lipoprotein-anchoring transpeptidase ErfK/SrfK